MMGSRPAGPDSALSGSTEFLTLAQSPTAFADKLTEIRTAIEALAQQEAALNATRDAHAARETALTQHGAVPMDLTRPMARFTNMEIVNVARATRTC
jgi:hypothetical protein